MRCGFARFVYHSLCLCVCLGQNFGMPLLGFGQLLLDLLGIQLRLLNSFPPFLEHGNDRPEREFLQNKVNNDEEDELSQKFWPFDTKCVEKFFHGWEKAAQPEAAQHLDQ